MSYSIPPTLAVEKIRVVKLKEVSINGEQSVQPAYSGWLDSPLTTHSSSIFAICSRKNAYYAVLTGLQPNGRFLTIIDADTQELTDWCFEHLPDTFTVKTRRGVHFYYWLDEMSFGQIQLFLPNTRKAGEIQGNRFSARGPNQTIACVDKSYHATHPKKPISTITRENLELVKSTFSKLHANKESKPASMSTGRYERLSNSNKPQVKISVVLQAANINVRNRQCRCPFHDDKNPSMSVSDEKGLAYCFACAEGYNAITLYRALKKVGRL